MPKLGPGGGGGGGGNDGIPAGDYIIALRSFKRQKGKTSGKEYLRCRWVVCAGRLEGKSFFSNMSLDLSKEGTVNRWRILMEACGVDEEIELGSAKERNADEGDSNIREHFLNKPFKATVKTELNGNYTNNDIQMIHYVRTWTQEDKDDMDRWLDKLEGYQDDDGGGDEPSSAPSGGQPDNGWGPDNYDAPETKVGGTVGDDDDIPF